VGRLAVLVDAVDRDLDAVALRGVDDGQVLARGRIELGLGLVELPGSQERVGGDRHRRAEEEHGQDGHQSLFRHRPPSFVWILSSGTVAVSRPFEVP